MTRPSDLGAGPETGYGILPRTSPQHQYEHAPGTTDHAAERTEGARPRPAPSFPGSCRASLNHAYSPASDSSDTVAGGRRRSSSGFCPSPCRYASNQPIIRSV
jgi:hypothetical protein